MQNVLIAGLGNPGPQYELTRHNIGFLILDRLADRHGSEFESDRLVGRCTIKVKNKRATLIKPQTFMNNSGKALAYWMKAVNVQPSRTLTITDDIALPFGRIRIKPKGSAGGHNGLKSIEEYLSTNQYPRFRFGVGGDFPKGGQVEYVLGNFPPEELNQLNEILDQCADAIECFILEGIQNAMTKFNG